MYRVSGESGVVVGEGQDMHGSPYPGGIFNQFHLDATRLDRVQSVQFWLKFPLGSLGILAAAI